MKKLMITIAAISTMGVAMPANAQYWGPSFDRRIDTLRDQLQRGEQRGAITYREARPLREDLRKLVQLERQYSRGGFSRSEQDRLQRRIQTLRQKIDRAANNGTYERRNGRWDNDRDGWRDGHRDRDGRRW